MALLNVPSIDLGDFVKKIHPLWYPIGVFIIVRLVFPLLFASSGYLDLMEEGQRGLLAHDLIGGMKLPFFDYAADHYSGGSLVVGVLAVPFFLLLGPSLFALRCVPILFSLGVMLGWYFLIARHYTRRAALIAAWLFVLPPFEYLLWTSFAMGFHLEASFFIVIAFICLLEMTHRGKTGLLWPIGLGFVLGFGAWFVNSALIGVAVSLIWWVWSDHCLFFKKAFWVFVLSFAVGGAFWIPQNLGQSFLGVEYLKSGIVYGCLSDLSQTLVRLGSAVFTALPTLFTLSEGAEHLAFDRALKIAIAPFFACAFLYLAACIRREWRSGSPPPIHLFPILAAALHVLIVSFTRFGMLNYIRVYLMPVIPYLLVAMSLWLSSLWESGRRGRIDACIIVGLLMTPGLCGIYFATDLHSAGASLAIPGYSYEWWPDALYLRHRLHPNEYKPVLRALNQSLSQADLDTFYTWQLKILEKPQIGENDILSICKLLPEFPSIYREYYSYNIGICVASRWSRLQEAPAGKFEANIPQELRLRFRDGVELARVLDNTDANHGFPYRLPVDYQKAFRLYFLNSDSVLLKDGSIGVSRECRSELLVRSTQAMKRVEISLKGADRPALVVVRAGSVFRAGRLSIGESRQEVLALDAGYRAADAIYWKLTVISYSAARNSGRPAQPYDPQPGVRFQLKLIS